MNCQAPFDDDGPFAADDCFLPSGPPRVGRCPDCGDVHRLDLGCPVGELARMRLVALIVFFVVASGGLAAWGCSR